ncbi:uncharacterized protein LOC135331274 isoform X2 [Halichondria panicea]|uniref:uncharacterized protein LOC135331274 isoform X2 n=1 Tax=Halichondria panicea TaxID=6063 RepID=UPI00312BC784
MCHVFNCMQLPSFSLELKENIIRRPRLKIGQSCLIFTSNKLQGVNQVLNEMAKSARFHLLLIVALEMVVFAMADYHLGYNIISYSSSNNTLANGTCCGETCDTSCRTTLRLCFRDAGHPHNDVDSSCTIVQNRENANQVFFDASSQSSIPKYFSQTFQIYVRVSHSVNEDTATANFDPPFTDPLIDEIFIEANVSAVLFPSTFFVITEMYTVTGNVGIATLTIGVNARCAENYFGDGCEMLCDADGITNCTAVLTSPQPQIMPTDNPETPSQTSSSDQPSTPTTGPLVPTPANTIIPIAVGVSIAVLVLIIIGVIVIILIIYCVKKGKKGSWNPKRSTEPQFTLERAERNLTSNINRFSVISDNGEEVEYAMVNKSPARTSRARSPPTPPPPYSSDKPEVSETEEPVEIAPAMGETEDQPSDIRYASLNIHQGNGFGAENVQEIAFEVEAADTEEDQEPVSYTVVKHQDS